MTIQKELFGNLNDRDIYLFTLQNTNGMVVKIMNYGATITQITIPGNDGNTVSLVCGFDSFDEYFAEEYRANAPYFGCTVGRYCSQIKDSKFSLEGKEYRLAQNCGPNNLHGGTEGFDKKVWEATPIESENAMEFSLVSPDGEEGFPGKVEATVKMQLTDSNEIAISYSASTDKTTPLSMTNHSYFNLSGFRENVENFEVKVHSNQLQEMDETGAATGSIKDVSETVEDLRGGRKIGDVHRALGGGFEHFYVFDNPDQQLQAIAAVSDKSSGRRLEVFSTEPCMLFYTGKYTSDKLQRNPNEKYGQYHAFCCETHRWQNGPNIPGSPGTFLAPNEKFSSQTIFKFSW